MTVAERYRHMRGLPLCLRGYTTELGCVMSPFRQHYHSVDPETLALLDPETLALLEITLNETWKQFDPTPRSTRLARERRLPTFPCSSSKLASVIHRDLRR